MKSPLLVAVLLIGCGSSANPPVCGDAACPDGGPQLWGLSRGTSTFSVTSITGVDDGCLFNPASLQDGNGVPVTYVEATHVVSVGAPEGTPAEAAFGSGPVAGNNASLTRDNDHGDGAGCTWHQRDTSMFSLVDHNKFTLTVTLNRSTFAAGCPGVPASGACTSTWTWTLQKQ